MKLHFNNKTYFFNDNNISSHHLLLKSLVKINEKWQNIDNYYIATTEGFPMKPSEIVERDKTYYLKRRIKGSNSLYEKGNSYVITIIGSIFFGILTIIYYSFYLSKILVVIPKEIQTQLDVISATQNAATQNNKQYKELQANISQETQNNKQYKELQAKIPQGLQGKNNKGFGKGFDKGFGKGFDKMKGGLNIQKAKNRLGDFRSFVKTNWDKFLEIIKDNKFKIILCNNKPIVPCIVLKKKENHWGSILSFALFSTYIFMLLMPLITNAATTISCKSPGSSKLGIPFLLLLIPLILMFVFPYLLKLINYILGKLMTNPPELEKYRLAMSNTILVIILLIYLIIERSNISPLMGCMIIIGFIIFGLLKYIPTLNNIISSLSRIIGNWITNTTPIPDETLSKGVSLNSNSISAKIIENAKENPQPDCWKRYRVIFDILWSIVMTLAGWGLMTGIYASQVRKHCKMT